MARTVKCQLCGKEITNDVAFKIKKGRKNLYYCSKEEYDSYTELMDHKKRCLETVRKIMEIPVLTPIMVKEVNDISKYYDYVVIEKCFKEQEKSIQWFLHNNNNSNEYGKARYISTIIRNNINTTNKKHLEETKQMQKLLNENENVDIDIVNMNFENKAKKEVSDISMFLE